MWLTFSSVMEISSWTAFFFCSGVDIQDSPSDALTFHSFFSSSVNNAHFALNCFMALGPPVRLWSVQYQYYPRHMHQETYSTSACVCASLLYTRCQQLVKRSSQYKTSCRIMSTLVGHSVLERKDRLESYRSVHMCHVHAFGLLTKYKS